MASKALIPRSGDPEAWAVRPKELAEAEIEMLYPTISMPVSIALFDLGPPIISDGTEETNNGTSIPTDDK
jgi:hypothetical protein